MVSVLKASVRTTSPGEIQIYRGQSASHLWRVAQLQQNIFFSGPERAGHTAEIADREWSKPT